MRRVVRAMTLALRAGGGTTRASCRRPQGRRARVWRDRARTVLVQWSAPPRVFSRDVDYEYRQDSNILYLTGMDQDERRSS